jgi:hypothetical protein
LDRQQKLPAGKDEVGKSGIATGGQATGLIIRSTTRGPHMSTHERLKRLGLSHLENKPAELKKALWEKYWELQERKAEKEKQKAPKYPSPIFFLF